MLRATDQAVSLEAYEGADLVAPTSATLTIRSATGDAIVDAAACTIAASVATYTVAAADIPDTLAYGRLYTQLWAMTMPDGRVYEVRREMALSPYVLRCPVAVPDLLVDYPGLADHLGTILDPVTGLPLTPDSFIGAAWNHVLNRLWAVGRWPDLMISSAAFTEVTKEAALYRVFRALYQRTTGANRWETLMVEHRGLAKEAWAEFRSMVDENMDGLPDSADMPQATPGVVHRNGAPSGYLSGNW